MCVKLENRLLFRLALSAWRGVVWPKSVLCHGIVRLYRVCQLLPLSLCVWKLSTDFPGIS